MAKSTIVIAGLTSAGILQGCGEAGSDAGSLVRRDSAGVEIVENHATGPLPADGWIVDPEPSARIGGVEADSTALFTTVRRVTRLTTGEIIVQSGDPYVSVYDGRGRYLRRIGRSGSGPGEFPYDAWGLTRGPNDTIYLRSTGRNLLMVFTPGGVLVRETRLDREALQEAGVVFRFMSDRPLLSDGSLLHLDPVPELTPSSQERVPPGLHRSGHRILRIGWDGASVDTLGVLRGTEQLWWDAPGGSAITFISHPFLLQGVMAVGIDPDRVYIANNPEYSIERWTPDGRLERIIRRSGARYVPTAEQTEASWAKADTDEEVRMFRDAVVTPDSLAAVRGLATGPDGELWVQRRPIFDEDQESVFDVFAGDGRFIGAVSLPLRVTLQEAGEDYLLTTRSDEWDVPVVEAWRLRRGG